MGQFDSVMPWAMGDWPLDCFEWLNAAMLEMLDELPEKESFSFKATMLILEDLPRSVPRRLEKLLDVCKKRPKSRRPLFLSWPTDISASRAGSP